MAKGDVRIFDAGGRSNIAVWKFPTKYAETAINAGEPVVRALPVGGTTGSYVIVLTDGKPVRITDYFVGIAANAGSHTSTADGYVDVYLDQQGIVYACKAKTAGDIGRQEGVDYTVFYKIPFDLTSSKYTADLVDATTNGLLVIGGDPTTSTVYFVCMDGARWTRSAT